MVENGKHGQGTHSAKMGADKLAENTPNAPNVSDQIVCPTPKVLDFDIKIFGFLYKKDSMGVRSPWNDQTETLISTASNPALMY